MFKQITIIGMGLIGSSIARAITQKGLANKIIAVDTDENVQIIVRDLGIVDEVTGDAAKGVIGSDLVVLSAPVGVCNAIARLIGPALKPGAIVTDVGSVKQSVIDQVFEHLPASVHFVPAHPIAGTEHSGPTSGFAELFEGRWCILTPTPDSDIQAVQKISEFWNAIGAKIEIMDPKRHDLVLGITSHLPHLIAFTIVGTASDLEDDIKSEVIKYSASGFRGFTRIAASDPVVWRDVFLHNREAVLEILQRFSEDLTAMQKSIRRGDGKYLEDVFSRTRAIRRAITEMGPEGLPSPVQKTEM
jgi:cyclohexadieny/prephenate dehydrogenase